MFQYYTKDVIIYRGTNQQCLKFYAVLNHRTFNQHTERKIQSSTINISADREISPCSAHSVLGHSTQISPNACDIFDSAEAATNLQAPKIARARMALRVYVTLPYWCRRRNQVGIPTSPVLGVPLSDLNNQEQEEATDFPPVTAMITGESLSSDEIIVWRATSTFAGI